MISAIIEIGSKILSVIDKSVPDQDLRLRLQSEIQQLVLQQQQLLLQAQERIITAEAKSESWLTRTWRPIVMLALASIMIADWLGFTAPNLPTEIRVKLLDIIQLGLGGYIIGRSAEKVIPKTLEALKASKGGGS